MALSAKDLVDRYNAGKNTRAYWEPAWQEIADHLIPRKGNITHRKTPGTKIHKDRYTSTGMHAHEILAANLQGTLTSRAFRWFDLRLGAGPDSEELSKDAEVQAWLRECSVRLWRQFNSSNFHSQCHEFYLDITGFGTAALFHEKARGKERFNGFRFTSYPIESYIFEENDEGMVDSWCCLLMYTALQARSRYGEGKLPKKIKDAIEKRDVTTRFGFIHWILPRSDRDETKVDQLNKKYASVHICLESETIVEEGGYDEFPVYVSRWTKNAGECYGRGPGDVALADLKVLDKGTELSLMDWEKSLDPPWFIEDEGVIGNVDLRPGQGTVVRDKDSLWFYESRSRPDTSRLQFAELRQSVRQAFFADQLELPQSDRMTAEEIRTRVELMQRVLGPTLGRMETEFLNPLTRRAFNMMLDGGAFPEIPAKLQGYEIEVHYSGPLSRSERMSEVAAVDRWLAGVAGIANVDPGAFDRVDTDNIVRLYAENLDVPRNVMRDDKTVQDLREQRSQQQQQAQQAQLGLVQSQTAEKLAKAQAQGSA